MLLLAQTSFGQTPQLRLVPEDYPSPEAALSAADPGDTILLGGATDWFTNLSIDKPITITGQDGARLLPAQFDEPIIQIRSEGVTIQDLEFSFGIVGVEGLAEATNLNISNCTFEDIFGDAIRLTGCQEITIVDVLTASNAGRGVFLNQVDGFLLERVRSTDNGGSGFEIVANSGLVINCSSLDNQFDGFFVQGSDMSFVSNTLASNSGIGVFFFDSQRFDFFGNQMASNGQFGLLCLGVEGALFSNNIAVGNSDIGLLFDNTRFTSVVSNTVFFNGGGGAYYSPSTSDNLLAEDNQFMGNFLDAGAVDDGNNNSIAN